MEIVTNGVSLVSFQKSASCPVSGGPTTSCAQAVAKLEPKVNTGRIASGDLDRRLFHAVCKRAQHFTVPVARWSATGPEHLECEWPNRGQTGGDGTSAGRERLEQFRGRWLNGVWCVASEQGGPTGCDTRLTRTTAEANDNIKSGW